MKRSQIAFVAMAGSAGTLWLAFVTARDGFTPLGSVLLFAVLAGLVEQANVSIARGSRVSASYLVILVAGAMAGPVGAGFAGASAGITATLFRRRPLSRVVFNTGTLVVAAVAAAETLALTPSRELSIGAPAVGLAAVAVNLSVNAGLVAMVVFLDQGARAARSLVTAFVRLAPTYAGLGLAAILLGWQASSFGFEATISLVALGICAAITLRLAVAQVRSRQSTSEPNQRALATAQPREIGPEPTR